jgi:hypothetical protein
MIYRSELNAFFEEVLHGHVETKNLQATADNHIELSQGYAQLIRNFLARRLNFLEVVAGAFNAELADRNLVEQFFGRMLESNEAYRVAVNLNQTGWPELARFYSRATKD